METSRALKSTVHHRKSPMRVQRAREMAEAGETLRSIVVETSLTDTAVARIMAEVDGQPLPAEARLIYEWLQQGCATVAQLAVVIGAAPPGLLARSADQNLVRSHVHMLRRRLQGRTVDMEGDGRGPRRYRLT